MYSFGIRALVGASACVASISAFAADAPGVSDTEVVIGAHTSESGTMAVYSSFCRATAAYFDSVNEKGGVNGRKLKFVRLDVQGEPAKAALATRKLVDETKVFAVVGAMGAAHQAAYKYLIEKGVPDLFFSDNLKLYGEPFKKLLFPGSFSYEAESRAYAKHALANFKGKKACFLLTDNTAGEEFLTSFKATVDEANKTMKPAEQVKIGAVERVDRLAAQANSQILTLKKDGCDVVVTSTLGGLAPNAITYAQSQQFKPMWYVSQFNINPSFSKLLPEGAKDGIISATTVPFDETFNATGWADYSATLNKLNIPLGRSSAAGWSTGELFVEALKRAGKDLTREKIVSAAESLNGWKCGMCAVPVALSPTQHWTFSEPFLVITDKGNWKKM